MLARKNTSRLFVFLLVIITLLSSLQLSVMSVSSKFAIEDLYNVFETDQLPTWKDIRDVYREEYNPPTDDALRKQYFAKRDLATAVILGFQKSSEYNSFKSKVEKFCDWDSEGEELLPKGYNDESVTEAAYKKNENEFDAILRTFDSKMSVAATREVIDITEVQTQENWFTRLITRGSNWFIGLILNIVQNADRIAVTLMSLQFACECMYLSVDILRPVLGFEIGVGKRKRQDYESYLGDGRGGGYVDDYRRVFRVVGTAARSAADQEFKISEDMSSAFKNDIFVCFIRKKISQFILIGLALVFSAGGVWGGLIIWIVNFFSGLA